MIDRRHWHCVDCHQDTSAIKEYYMVTFDLWDCYGAGSGMLCIGCLEARIGRLLQPDDFTDAPINDPDLIPKSQRLLSRLPSTG